MIDVKLIKKPGTKSGTGRNGISGGTSGTLPEISASLQSLMDFNAALSGLLTPCDKTDNELSWLQALEPDGAGGIKAKSLKAKVGLWTDSFLSCLGKSDTGGSGGGGGGLVESIYRWADLGGTFSDTDNDTFNAYTLNRIYSELTAADSAISARLANFYTKSEADTRYALANTLSGYVKKAGDTMSGPLTIATGSDAKIIINNTDDETNWNLISFRDKGVEYGKLGTQGGTSITWNGNLIFHGGNYASYLDQRYLLKSAYTAADVLAKIKTVDGAASGLDADLLDGYHASLTTAASTVPVRDSDGLLRLPAVRNSRELNIRVTAAGWYRVFTSAMSDAQGDNILLSVSRLWNLSANEAYHFSISVRTYMSGYKPCITQLSGTFSTHFITKIRVVQKFNSIFHIDIYCANGINDYVYISGFGSGTFCAPVAATIPDGYTAMEFDTVQGFKCNEELVANAATATRLQGTYKLWGQDFYGNDVSGNMTGVGTVTASGEIKSTAPNGFRIAYANYGLILRNDGNNSYFLLTDSGDANGNFNSLRPFLINNSTGRVSMNNGMSASTATISGLLAAHGGVQIGADADTGWYRYLSRITAGNATAKGVNVGSLLVSDRWADGDKVPANGIYVRGPLRIGDITIEEDKVNGALHIVGGGLYADTFITAMGVNPNDGSGTGGGGGMSYDRLDAWADYSADKAGYVLSALLGNDLYQNKLGKTEAQSLYQPIGNYLTAHQALDYLNVKDVRGAERLPGYFADRRMSLWFNNTGTPADGYWWAGFQVKGWDNTYGSWQLCASSHNTATRDKNLYFRVGKDDAWEAWRTILDTSNFNTLIGSGLTAYVKKTGDTMTGPLQITQINDQTGSNALLATKKAATGVTATQWLVGPLDAQGVIRSSNASLLHYRNAVGVSTIWDSGNDGAGSGLDADLLDGYHETVFVRDRDLGSRGDYQHVVFLLWKDSEIANHHIQGKLFTMGGGGSRYQAAAIDIWFSRWSTTGYDWKGRFDTWGLGTMMRLVTCTYNGEKWWAVEHTNTQAINLYFTGTARNVAWTMVHYYTSNTSTVVNSEIYSSREAVDIGTYTVNGIRNALVSDTVANASALGGIAASEYLTKSNYAATLDGRYVNKAGDTVAGPLTIQTGVDTKLVFNNTDGEKYTRISFRESGTEYTAITASKVEVFVSSLPFVAKYFRADTETLCPKLNADLLDGYHGSDYLRSFWTNNPGYDCSTITNKRSFCTFTYGNNAPFTGGFVDINANGYGFYLGTSYVSDQPLYYRRHGTTGDGGMGTWQQLARITDNVASATRLATTASFTAWGQIFFANGVPKSIEGNLNGVGDIGARGGAYGNFQITRGLATGEAMRIEPLDANGSWLKNCITMDTDGNLKIGSTGRATHKLHVNGYVRSNGLTLDGSHLLEWDAANTAWKFNGNLYATGGISALGITELSATEATVDTLNVKSRIVFQGSNSPYIGVSGTSLGISNTGPIIMGNASVSSRVIGLDGFQFGANASYYVNKTGDAVLKSLIVRTSITAASIAIKTAVFTVEGTEIYVTAGETKYKLLKTAVS